MDAIPADVREDENVKNILTGVEMTDSELLNTLAKHKIEKIDAEGKKFDPNFHQAMFEIENPDVENGTVLQVVQAGYMISGRLLRPASLVSPRADRRKNSLPLISKSDPFRLFQKSRLIMAAFLCTFPAVSKPVDCVN